jgi:hypothetical protein
MQERLKIAFPTVDGYNAGMQYTLRNVPPTLDRALRRRAREEGKSLNSLLLETLAEATLGPKTARKRDLSDIVGTWVADAAFDEAIADQDRIDPDMWK